MIIENRHMIYLVSMDYTIADVAISNKWLCVHDWLFHIFCIHRNRFQKKYGLDRRALAYALQPIPRPPR